MHIRHLHHPLLSIDELTVTTGQSWCFYGSGRSGINEFLGLLEGKREIDAEALDIPSSQTVISFNIQQDIFEDEIRNDDSDFLDRPDPGTLAHEFLPADALDSPIIDAFDLRASLNTGYRQLSSGQGRKLLVLQAILSGAQTIVIDSPYDGLDPLACIELDQAFQALDRKTLRILVLVRNLQDIPQWCDHLAIFEQGTLNSGTRTIMLERATKLANDSTTLFDTTSFTTKAATSEGDTDTPLIALTDGRARYGENTILTGLNLSVNDGQHTLITGPNGCGKSTLLHIFTGDNPNCYSNDLQLFGKQRGTGESIWELKKKMGIVSPEIHRNYRVPGSALHVVLSGLFDSIGLYQHVSSGQKRDAMNWLSAIDMAEQAQTPFRQLSYGDQRLVLIARSLIKMPPLLILDEPTQGLDSGARHSLLDFLEKISRGTGTTILYVSHREDEYRSFFKQHIRLERYHP